MSKQKQKEVKTQQQFENIEETLTKTEEFIIHNQKTLTVVVLVLVAILLGFFGVKKYYIEPKNKEAQEQVYPAQRYFEADSLDKALYGDGNSLGFVDIAKNYSMTKAGNLANYYAGVCFLKKGDFDQAISYLSDFDADDEIIAPMAKGALGDAYLEKGDRDKAVAAYESAATMKENEFTSPMFLMKAGELYELMGQYDDAIDAYTTVKEKYFKSEEAKNIDKYIARAQAASKSK
jgi:predicted negative regulator of RcsB-dependent stress response